MFQVQQKQTYKYPVLLKRADLKDWILLVIIQLLFGHVKQLYIQILLSAGEGLGHCN